LKPLFQKGGSLPALLALSRSANSLARSTALKALAQLALNDDVMVGLYENASLLLEFLQSTELDVQLNGAMIIGNLARNDEHCLGLVEAGCVGPLVRLLAVKDPRVQQLVAGALRNLAIPPPNKVKIVNAGALPPLITLLSSTNAHAMFAAIGALKCLMTTAEGRREFMRAGGVGPLCKIKDAIIIDASQADHPDGEKKPKDLRIQCEAARTLALLLEDREAVRAVVEHGGLGLLNFLLESGFEILQFEGVKAVRSIVETADIDLQMLVEAGILDNLVGLVSRAKTDSVKLDDLVVISLLLEHESCKQALQERGLVDALQCVAQSGSSELSSLGQRLLSKLTM